MIITVTPNPSFDRTITVAELLPGDVHRALSSQVELGGKGINVTRALSRAGFESVAITPANVADRALIADLERGSGDVVPLELRFVEITDPIRNNVTVVAGGGETTKLNESGPTFTNSEVERLQEVLAGVAADGSTGSQTWLAGCGSLPPGVEDDFYGSMVDMGEALGILVAVDTSGPALKAAVKAGCRLIKPNHEELAELVGRPIRNLGDAIDGAKQVVRDGVETVLVSLGGNGALCVNASEAVFGSAPADEVVNTVGAGDAFMAGALSVGGRGVGALAEGLAWGRAAVMSAGTSFPAIDDSGRANIVLSTEVDVSIRLVDDA